MARADRRQQLVASAQEVFVTQGFAAASMDDVAERAGVTKPVLYDHFGSKDGLLTAVLGRLGDLMLETTARAVEGATSPREALERGLTAYFRFVDQHAGAWSLMLREVAPGSAAAVEAERVRGAQVAVIAELVRLHLPGCDAARAEVYAHAVSGAAERLAAVRLTGRRVSAARAATLLMDVMWSGFAQLQREGIPA
jgi:AcrR family transcriptional regulator